MNCYYIVILFLLMLVLQTGCATVIHGAYQAVFVSTEPQGAVVRDEIENKEWVTPAVIRVKRKNTPMLTVIKKGYLPHKLQFKKVINHAIIGNILIPFGTLSGVAIDLMTGAQWSLVPNTVTVQLVPTIYMPQRHGFLTRRQEVCVVIPTLFSRRREEDN
jgi:hypothetical protein